MADAHTRTDSERQIRKPPLNLTEKNNFPAQDAKLYPIAVLPQPPISVYGYGLQETNVGVILGQS
jgi:hypothetical protein